MTFSGAEVYIKMHVDASPLPEEMYTLPPPPRPDWSVCTSLIEGAAEALWKSQNASDRAKEMPWPMARISSSRAADINLKRHYTETGTFSGAKVEIQPISNAITIGFDHPDWDWYEYLRDNHDPRIGWGARMMMLDVDESWHLEAVDPSNAH